jgi:hypothetical protein
MSNEKTTPVKTAPAAGSEGELLRPGLAKAIPRPKRRRKRRARDEDVANVRPWSSSFAS